MESLQYTPKEAIPASLPEIRGYKEQIIKNLEPGALPTELDLALSDTVIRKMNRSNKY